VPASGGAPWLHEWKYGAPQGAGNVSGPGQHRPSGVGAACRETDAYCEGIRAIKLPWRNRETGSAHRRRATRDVTSGRLVPARHA